MLKTGITVAFRLIILLMIIYIIVFLVMVRPSLSVQGAHLNHGRLIQPEPLKQHVQALSEQFSPRSYQDVSNLNQAADYITHHFRLAGLTVVEQAYEIQAEGNEKLGPYKNIIGILGPETNDVIVVGAHYDSVSMTPGANDNASGVASLIELAKSLSQAVLTKRVHFVAFTLEEQPYFNTEDQGSRVYVRWLVEKQKNVDLMINLEMLGYYSEEANSQSFPYPWMSLFYPSRGNFLALIDQMNSPEASRMKKYLNRVMNLPVYSINAPLSMKGVTDSDHSSFWQHGFPAVMVTDTAYYRYPYYHKKEDTWDHLDYDKMSETVYGLSRYVFFLGNQTAESPTKAAWWEPLWP